MKSKLLRALVVVTLVSLAGCVSAPKPVAHRSEAQRQEAPWYVRMFQASLIEMAKETPGSAR
jgi:hypothetical protein